MYKLLLIGNAILFARCTQRTEVIICPANFVHLLHLLSYPILLLWRVTQRSHKETNEKQPPSHIRHKNFSYTIHKKKPVYSPCQCTSVLSPASGPTCVLDKNFGTSMVTMSPYSLGKNTSCVRVILSFYFTL